jgi:uncharacterized protein (DUF362 family)
MNQITALRELGTGKQSSSHFKQAIAEIAVAANPDNLIRDG